MDISIVIPAFNEERKIRRDIEHAAAFIHNEAMSGEVIVVDDGSTDNTLGEAGKANIPPSVKLDIIVLEKNLGKGAAVKRGILSSLGNVVIFADSGTCIPYTNALVHIARIRAGNLDMAMASRRLPDTVIRRNRSYRRRLLSWIFRQMSRLLIGIPHRFTDTQCGFKIYRGEIARLLFAECHSNGYVFELEILLRALKRNYRIEEFPVEWSCDLDTRLRPRRDAAGVLKEMLKIRAVLKKDSD